MLSHCHPVRLAVAAVIAAACGLILSSVPAPAAVPLMPFAALAVVWPLCCPRPSPGNSARPPRDRNSEHRRAIAQDVKRFWSEIRRKGLFPRAKSLTRPCGFTASCSVASDWGLIAAAAWLALGVSPWFIPLAVLVIGNRQRALGNLVHEAEHGCLYLNRKVNDRVADWLAGYPMFTSLRAYAIHHDHHHLWLGAPAVDPDWIHRESLKGRPALLTFAANFFSGPMYRGSLLGNLPDLTWSERLRVAGWWSVVLGAITSAAGTGAALGFAALWFAARATAYHALTTFREITDHVGLRPGSVVGFTRNLLHSATWLEPLFHPHHNGYHLVHHLGPAIPYHRQPEAHVLFMASDIYRAGHHCDGYFRGGHPAVRCWTGECPPRPSP